MKLYPGFTLKVLEPGFGKRRASSKDDVSRLLLLLSPRIRIGGTAG